MLLSLHLWRLWAERMIFRKKGAWNIKGHGITIFFGVGFKLDDAKMYGHFLLINLRPPEANTSWGEGCFSLVSSYTSSQGVWKPRVTVPKVRVGVILLMEEILHYLQIMGYTWINYQPQLVIAGFLNHQQYFMSIIHGKGMNMAAGSMPLAGSLLPWCLVNSYSWNELTLSHPCIVYLVAFEWF